MEAERAMSVARSKPPSASIGKPTLSRAIVTTLFSAGASSPEAWRAVLDERVQIRIGNRRPAIGLEAALAELASFLEEVIFFGGRFHEAWELEGATLVETDIVRRASPSVHDAIPCAVVFRTGGGPLARDVRFYLDPGPLLAAKPYGTTARPSSSRRH